MKRDQEDQDFKRTNKLAQPVKVPTVKHKSGSPLGPRRETTPIKLSSVCTQSIQCFSNTPSKTTATNVYFEGFFKLTQICS